MRPSLFRTLHLTPEHVARATRPVEEVPHPLAYVRATDGYYEALTEGLWPKGPPVRFMSSLTAR